MELVQKYFGFLDHIGQIFEILPLWFKIWIYTLIFLIFLTIAGASVFYINSKERLSLRYFSMEGPANNAEIPLGESRSWMLHGHFPMVQDPELSRGAGVEVEVLKLPVREHVPQAGRARISTVEGVWTFESATFPGEGDYEIVATGRLGGLTVFRRATVKCLEKAEAYRRLIAEDRQARDAPEPVFLPREAIDLPALYGRLHDLQQRFFQVFPSDLAASQEVVADTLQAVDGALVSFPNDLYLQNVRAYSFKNYAVIMKQLGRTSEFSRALDEAARMFEAILQQAPADPGAWNGLGSVALLRQEPRVALHFIDRALAIKPDYAEALHDREIAQRMLGDTAR